MTKACDFVHSLIPHQYSQKEAGIAFAPANIALAKYWGKRDTTLNLPQNSSLSISLADKGAHAKINCAKQQEIIINGKEVDLNTAHAQRILHYLHLFSTQPYRLELTVNIPFAAGLASSAAVFAAIVLALNDLHQWQLSTKSLSLLARLGSGSAARSIEPGFVLWHKGKNTDGTDSYAEALETQWPEFCVGLCLFSTDEKPMSSRVGMELTKNTSPLYSAWPNYAEQVAANLQPAIRAKDFTRVGTMTEQCAQTLHALMLSAWPSLDYSLPETLRLKLHIWELRKKNIEVYFTQDAGPNLKILFLSKQLAEIKAHFPQVIIINPFTEVNHGC